MENINSIAQTFQKLIFLHLVTDCFMKASPLLSNKHSFFVHDVTDSVDIYHHI